MADKKATFASGCFWCTEAIFRQVEGVKSATSGYTGGHIKNPAYREVCTGRTGHAEAVEIIYDPAVVDYPDLLEIFWATHNPTTLNQQGADKGTQYRSAIFYHDEEQRHQAELSKTAIENTGVWDKPIVTEIAPASKFYPAGEDHQQYYERQPDAPYCSYVIAPKLDKFRQTFRKRLRLSH